MSNIGLVPQDWCAADKETKRWRIAELHNAGHITARLDGYEPGLVDSLMIYSHIEKMNSRLLLSLWLALALLFAQQGAALHALSHLADSAPAQSQQEKQLPHSPACDKCVAYAGVGSAAASSPPLFSAPATTATLATVLFLLFFAAPLRYYLSRAPPRLN